MDNYVDIAVLGTEDRFAIGQPVPRSEDPVLVRGEGHYSDDFNLPGQAYAVIVRSPMAHGLIHKIETSVARAMPGVLAVHTAADLEKGGIGPLPARQVMNNRDGTPMLQPVRHALATDKVRYVGEAVAAVIAETVAQAKDAAEAAEVDIEALPAVTEPSAATAPGGPRLYDDVPENVGLDFHFGDSAAVAEAFARAAHVTRLELRSNRIVVNPIEPRAALAEYDSARRHFTLHVGCQGVFGFRNYIAGVLGVGRDEVRIITDRVGGSFGMKQPNMSEYFCLLHAARELRRPVKWTDERSGSFVSDTHGREAQMTAELALDMEGNFLAVRLTGYGNVGATYGAPGPSTRNAVRNTLGVYKTPLIEVTTKCVFTNTTPVGAYRGAGRPEANYYMERLVDTAAREMGIDQVDIRMRRVHQPPQQGGDLGRVGRVSRAKRGEPSPRQITRARHQRLSRTDGTARPRDGRHPLRAERRCDDHHRLLGLRAGALVSIRPSVGDEAWHPIPKHPPHSGRQRRIDRGRRHRWLQIDDCQRQRDRRRRREGGRGRPADRRARAGGRRGGHRVPRRPLCHCRHRPLGGPDGIGRPDSRRPGAAIWA